MKKTRELLKKNTSMYKLLVTMLFIVPVIAAIFISLKSSERTGAATTGTVTAASLFVRTGPGTTYDKLTVNGNTVMLSKGDYVAISYETNGWYYVTASYKGTKITGFVSAAYIATNGTIPTAAPSATPTPRTSVTKTPTPKPTATPTPRSQLTTEVVKEGFPLIGYVTAGRLNVRKGPGTENEKIDGIDKDQKVTVQEATKAKTGEYWYKISYKSGSLTKEGYVSAEYIAVDLASKATPTPTPTNKPENTPTPEATKAPEGPTPTPKISKEAVTEGFPYTGFCNTSGLNVRKGPGTSYERVTSITLNQYVTLLGYKLAADGKVWYEVTFAKNDVTYKGYASSTYISVVLPTPTPEPTATSTPVPTATPEVKETPTPTSTPAPEIEFVGEQIEKEDIEGLLFYSYSYTGIVNTYQLNMRDMPEATAATINTYPEGTKVLVLDRVLTGSTQWYKVAVKRNGIIDLGYLSAKYTKLVFTEEVYAYIIEDGVKLRNTTSSTSSFVKAGDGSIVALLSGTEVYVTAEENKGGQKWFKIKTPEGITGYILSTELEIFEGNMLVVTPTPTPTDTPTPTPTKVPGTESTPTPVPTQGGILGGTPTPVPTKPVFDAETGKQMYHYYVYEVLNGVATLSEQGLDYYFPAISMTAPIGYLFDHNEVFPETVTTGYSSFIKAHMLEQDETYYYYYVRDPNIAIQEEWNPEMTAEEFESYMDSQGFPETYKPYLREIHWKHPNWILTADRNGISWDDAIASENVAGRNLIPNSYNIAWKSLENGAYSWEKDQFIVYDGSSWVTASAGALAYFIDPRNWLNETNIFMFESLVYKPDYQTVEGVEALLVNTPFYHTSYSYVDSNGVYRTTTYAETFIVAAEYSGVSPYHLASRVRQEIVTSSTTVSDSATGTVSGYEGLYNFYNIGAYHSTVSGGAIKNGLKYARNGASNNDALNTGSLIPWTDPFRAIVGGAYVIGQNYINRGQDTIYLQKFNMTADNTFTHQYMANVVAPSSESKRMATAYTDLSTPVTFSIPVFENMPNENSPKPGEAYSPNNWLKSLIVYDNNGIEKSLAPEFSISVDQEYYVSVPLDCDYIQIVATPVSGKASVVGNGVVGLNYGMNTFIIQVIAEDGSNRNYILNIVRQEY